jgi:uncharacterized phage protein gp47/JayE
MAFGVTPVGFEIKRFEDIDKELIDAFKAAFGQQHNLSTESKTGQLKAIYAERESLLWQLAQAIYDSFSIEKAENIDVDNLASLTNETRDAATSSILTGRIGGTPTTLVAAGFIGSVFGSPTSRFQTLLDATIGATGIDEVQSLAFSDIPDSGSFQLVFGLETTTAILFSDAAIDIENALNALTTLSAVSVSGNFTSGFIITFTGADGETTQAKLQVTNNTLVLLPSTAVTVTVTEDTKGFPPFIDVEFEAEVTGPTVANADTFTVIETPVAGVTQLTNSLDAILGRDIQTDSEFKQTRKENLQKKGTAANEGIRNAVLAVEDVIQVIVVGNRTSAIDLDGRPPHSFETIVDGGVDQDIAETIFASGAEGIQAFGSITVPVIDSQGFSHDIGFSRATVIEIHMIVNIVQNLDPTEGPLYPATGDQDVEDAILAFTQDFRINQDVIVNQLFTPINTIAGIIGIEILIGTSPSPTLSDNIPIGTVEKSDFDGSRITVNS